MSKSYSFVRDGSDVTGQFTNANENSPATINVELSNGVQGTWQQNAPTTLQFSIINNANLNYTTY